MYTSNSLTGFFLFFVLSYFVFCTTVSTQPGQKEQCDFIKERRNNGGYFLVPRIMAFIFTRYKTRHLKVQRKKDYDLLCFVIDRDTHFQNLSDYILLQLQEFSKTPAQTSLEIIIQSQPILALIIPPHFSLGLSKTAANSILSQHCQGLSHSTFKIIGINVIVSTFISLHLHILPALPLATCVPSTLAFIH